MNQAEKIADWINWTIRNHPEVIRASTEGIGAELHLWGGSIVFDPNHHGSGTYYVNDTSGG